MSVFCVNVAKLAVLGKTAIQRGPPIRHANEPSPAVHRDAEDFPGTERFLIAQRLGAGSYGVVYEAWDREEKASVALKVLRYTEPDALYRFKNGVRLLADLRHPNLAAFYGLESVRGWWFLTMELVEGLEFVEAHRGESRPSPPADAERLRRHLVQLARGLHALHRHGRLHRDVKPSNVMVTHDGRVVLLDFGLVTELERVDLLPSDETRLVGTPAYMAPEQAEGLPISPASDWYSAGVMLYETLTGELPFRGSLVDVLRKKLLGKVRDPREIAPATPDDLAGLALDLLRPEVSERPTAEEVFERLGSAQPPEAAALTAVESSFVGRREALAVLEDALGACRDRAVSVYVRGSSGVGKTALVHHFLDELRGRTEEEVIVLRGRCYLGESVPYKAIDSLIDELSRFLAELPEPAAQSLLPEDAAELGRLFPVLRTVEAVAREGGGELDLSDPQALRRRGFRALRGLLGTIARRATLVLFIDDLQWGDVDSFELLEEVLRPPEAPPLLMIGCYRREDLTTSPFLVALSDHVRSEPSGDVREIELGGLSRDEARELVEALQPVIPTGGTRLEPHEVESIAGEADGSPLFLSELLRGWRLPERRSADRSGLSGVVLARVARLPDPERRMLEVVALGGQPLDVAVAGRAAGVAAGYGAVVDRLHGARLLRRVAAEGPSAVEVYHDRIREAVVEALDPALAERHHRRLAAALEAAGAEDPESLVVHFRATHQLERAREYALRAAEKAEEALAFERAARLFRLVLDLTPAESPDLYRLRMKLGHALAHAGRGREAAESMLAAVENSGKLDPLEAQREAAEQLLVSGHVDRGLAILRHVLRTVGLELKTPRWKALLELRWLRLRLALHFRLHGLRKRFGLAESAGTPEQECDPVLLRRIDVCWSVEIGLCLVDVVHASEFHARHLLLSLSAGEPRRIARGMAMEVFFGSLEGSPPRPALVLARRLAARLDDGSIARLAETAAGIRAAVRGEWYEASRRLRNAEEKWHEEGAGVAWELDTVQHFRTLARLHLGHWAELFAELPRLLKRTRARGDRFLEIHLRHWVECLRYLAEDRPGEAEAVASEALEDWPQQDFHFQHLGHLVAVVAVALYRGDGARALELVEARWTRLERSHARHLEITRVLSHDLAARAALAAAGAEKAPRYRAKLLGRARRHARRLERIGSNWAGALASLIRAGISSLAGTPPRDWLEKAEALFQAADMPLHEAVARRRRAQCLGAEDQVVRADRVLGDQGVRDPERMADVLAPGGWA